MTFREKSKGTRLTEAKLNPSGSFRKVDSARAYGSESAAGAMRAVHLATTVSTAEQRVLSLVSRAWTNKEIAAALGISPATVKRHIEKILNKLGLRNRVEIALFGFTLNGCPHQMSAGCALRQPETLTDKKPIRGPTDP